MMKLSCKDVNPSTACDFEATGNSAPEVAGKMMAHVKTDHPEAMEGKTGGDMMQMLQSKVHS